MRALGLSQLFFKDNFDGKVIIKLIAHYKTGIIWYANLLSTFCARKGRDFSQKISTAMEGRAMPSEVFDKKHIRTPEGDEEWGGKWMLFHRQLLDAHHAEGVDCQNGGRGRHRPLLHATGEARRAARAIRRVVDWKSMMFYKLNEQTSRGIANRFGDKGVSIHMQTFLGGFYTRKNGVWMLDDEESEGKTAVIDNKFCKENYSGNENLPSNRQEPCFWNLPENHGCDRTGCDWWYLFCSCEDDEGPHLSEADRVWTVARQLLEEGLFAGLFLKKIEKAKCEVRLFVSRDCDVYSRLAACDRIFEEASCRTVMHFVQTKSRNRISPEGHSAPVLCFVYTPDGELYVRTKYAEEYLSVRGEH